MKRDQHAFFNASTNCFVIVYFYLKHSVCKCPLITLTKKQHKKQKLISFLSHGLGGTQHTHDYWCIQELIVLTEGDDDNDDNHDNTTKGIDMSLRLCCGWEQPECSKFKKMFLMERDKVFDGSNSNNTTAIGYYGVGGKKKKKKDTKKNKKKHIENHVNVTFTSSWKEQLVMGWPRYRDKNKINTVKQKNTKRMDE